MSCCQVLDAGGRGRDALRRCEHPNSNFNLLETKTNTAHPSHFSVQSHDIVVVGLDTLSLWMGLFSKRVTGALPSITQLSRVVSRSRHKPCTRQARRLFGKLPERFVHLE